MNTTPPKKFLSTIMLHSSREISTAHVISLLIFLPITFTLEKNTSFDKIEQLSTKNVSIIIPQDNN
jgi:hypothetical protein